MANSKDIELVIRTTDLSSKPIDQIDKAVTDLAKAVSDLGPAAQRGEVKLGELQRVAVKLEQALKGLAANQSVVDRFNEITKAISAGEAELAGYAQRVEEARKALAGAAKPTKDLTSTLKRAEGDYARQEKELRKLADQLQNLGEKATKAGIDLRDVGTAQAAIDRTLASTTAAYKAINSEIDQYDANQRQAAAAAQASAAAQKQAAEQVRLESERLALAQKEAGAAALFQQQHEQAAKLVKDAEYIRFWTEALQEKDRVEKAAADSTKLRDDFRATGVEAQKAAGAIGKATAEVDQLAQANKKAGASVRAIIDPEAELIKTLNGMETAVGRSVAAHKEFETQLKRTGRSTVDMKVELDQLGRVQSGAAGIAALIDRFRNTRAAAADAAVEMRRARTEVQQYAAAVQQADAPNEELAASLALAQQRLAAAEARYKSFAAAAVKLKGDVAAAGVNMRNLSGEMSRVENVARSATTAANTMSQAMERTGAAAKRGAAGFNLFTTGGRTTLSLAQRLRGEVLALAATYVGLYGAISGVGSVLDAVQQRAATTARLSVAFGAEEAGKEMAYVREQAERLGAALPSLADQYSKLAIGARAAGFSVQDTRFVFESFAEVGKVFNLTEDNIDGVFKGLEQIFSKGTVQAEELRGQLGDRLTGAFFEFAKSLGIATGDLNDWLKEGKVSSEFVLLFANQFRNKVAPQLGEASKSTASELNRFQTALNDLKLVVADSGFLDSFTEAVRKLTAYFQSAEGVDFAQKLGVGLAGLADLFIFLMDNIDAVKNTVIALGAVWATVFAARMTVSIVNTATEFSKLATLVATKAPRMAAALGMIGGALAAGFAGFQLGTWLNEEFAAVRKFGVLLVTGFEAMWTTIKRGAQIAATEWAGAWEDHFKRLYNIIVRTLKEILAAVAVFAQKLGFDDLASRLLDKAAALSEKRILGLGKRTAALRKQLEEELKAIAAIQKDMLAEAENPTKPGAAPASKPGVAAPAAAQTGLDPARQAELEARLKKMREQASGEELRNQENAAKRRIKLAEQIAAELQRIEQGITERGAKSLEERLAAIDTEYTALIKKIEKLGGADGASAKAKLDDLIVLRKQEETQKYNDEQRKARIEEIKQAEQAINDRVQVRDAMIEAENAKRRAGLLTEEEARLNIARITQQTNDQIRIAAEDTIRMIDALKDPAMQQSLAGVRANMEAIAANTVKIPEVLITQTQVLDQWADGLTNVATAAFDAAAASGDLGDGFKAAAQAFRQFAANFLREIATMILKQMILNALQASTGASGAAGMFSSMTAHNGGLVGSSGFVPRRVDPAIFANAPRYHSGGPVGLRSDERAAILQTGEEVLSRNDPRNVKNGGKNSSPLSVKVVNTFSESEVVQQGLNTVEGEQAVLNIVRRNKGALF